jgi:hypothetical protein
MDANCAVVIVHSDKPFIRVDVSIEGKVLKWKPRKGKLALLRKV